MKVHPEIIRFGASLALVDGDSCLFQKRDTIPTIFCPGCWGLPGGNIEKGEEPIEAATRELLEETGYKATNPFFFYSDVFLMSDNVYIKRYEFLDIYDKKQKISCFEGEEFVWLSQEELEGKEFVYLHDQIALRAIELVKNF